MSKSKEIFELCLDPGWHQNPSGSKLEGKATSSLEWLKEGAVGGLGNILILEQAHSLTMERSDLQDRKLGKES